MREVSTSGEDEILDIKMTHMQRIFGLRDVNLQNHLKLDKTQLCETGQISEYRNICLLSHIHSLSLHYVLDIDDI